MTRILFVVALVVLLPSLSMAEIYRWTDANGQVHFTDKADPAKEMKSVDVKINSADSVPIPVRPQKVEMYSTDDCVFCDQARKYFKRSGIPFVEYDIDKNKQAKRRFKALGGRGTPLIVMGDKKLHGFTKDRFDNFYR